MNNRDTYGVTARIASFGIPRVSLSSMGVVIFNSLGFWKLQPSLASRKGKGTGCEKRTSGPSTRSWDPLASEEGGSVCSHPSCKSLAFLPIPCVWFLKGVTADLLDSGLHIVNEIAEVCLYLTTSERASLFFTQSMDARNCTFMNLLTEKQFLLKELGLVCWHLPQKPLHSLISKKPK